MEEYDKNNKNIYIIDVKNGKWWFSIETITKIIVNKLSYFDPDTYNIVCQEPSNPYLNTPLNIGQLMSIYEQINRKGKLHKLLMIFRIANFDINMFLKIYNDDILNTSYKYNLDTLHNDSLYTIFHNLFCNNGIYYVNIYELDLDIENIKNEAIQLIKNCSFTYKNKNRNLRYLRRFINKYSYIIKRARRPLYEELYGEEIEEEENGEEVVDDINENREILVYSDETNINLEEPIDFYEFLDVYNEYNTQIIKGYILGYIVRKKYRNSIEKIKAGILGYIVRKKYRNSIEKIKAGILGYIVRKNNNIEEIDKLEECNKIIENMKIK